AFVTGMMGPYMSPMPIGASIAMLLSLIVALTLTPYLGYLFLREKDDRKDEHEHALEKTAIYKLYKKILDPMLLTRWKRWAFMIGTVVILLGSMVFFYTKWVAVKMLPFDNKNEFQVVIDMPEGTALEQTYAVTQEVSRYLATYPLVKNYQGYVGTAGPISFNGLVRHYDLRNGGNVAEIQVNLADKKERDLQSHDIVKELRAEVQRIGKRYGANIKLVELPPGPPVLSTIVAEVYGPDYEQQIKIAKQLQSLLERQQGIVDIDDMTEAEHKEVRLNIDAEKAMKMGIAPAQINQNVQAALSGISAGMVHREAAYEPVPVMIKLPDVQKSEQSDLLSIPVKGSRGNVVLAGVVAKASEEKAAQPIYRKNQQRVVFVLADMAGELESPFYAINSLGDSLKNIQVPKGYELREVYAKVPNYHDQYTIKWDGEWQITLEVFRDLGIAFVVVLIFIYMLIVGWFQNFSTPLIMLVAIPLSLIGIVLGHWMLDAYFTATSMIGFIALAGVMVRNSVLLIDFINIRLNEGVELKQAIIEAGAVRTTPILLTAGAVVLGAVIILFDPIFQGLAISLMGGTITSTILTLVVVPLLYFKMKKNNS
ncbi:MAG: efflux RND transporter permease subunit, partial [Chryseotalea sp.]